MNSAALVAFGVLTLLVASGLSPPVSTEGGTSILLAPDAVPWSGHSASPPAKVLPNVQETLTSVPHEGAARCAPTSSGVSCRAGALPGVSGHGWTNQTGIVGKAPPARSFQSSVYDVQDGYVLLFGGLNTSAQTLYGDTWSFSGGHWSQLLPSLAPSPRRAASIAYDPRDGYVVLFGGYGATGPLNDTWQFVGGSWTNITSLTPATNRPPPRFATGMTFDSADGYVLLFGGCTLVGCAASLNDTWSFAGGKWSEIAVSGNHAPSTRGGIALTWDNASSEAILYGGAAPTATHTNDTWAYRAGVWTMLSTSVNPGPLGDYFLVYDSSDGFVLLFGGLLDRVPPTTNAATASTWGFSSGAWTNLSNLLTSAPPPAWALEDAGAYSTALGEAVLFGGRPSLSTDWNQTWTFSMPLAASVAVAPMPVVQSEVARVTVSAGGGSLFYHYAYAGLPSACPSRDRPSVTCGFNVSGPEVVTVTVTDTVGAKVLATTAFTVAQRFVPVASANPGVGVVPFAVEINASAPGGVAPISYSWEFGDGSPNGTGSPVRHTYQTVGTFLVVLTATDSLGGVSSTNTTVRTYPALSSSAAATPGVGIAPLRVNFTGSSSGGVPPIAYVWTFADGSSGSAGSPDVSHSYGSPGAFNASLVVVDGQGHSVTISVPIRVVAPLAVAASRSPPNGTAPLTVLFVSAPYGGLSPLNYNWTFGDGAYSSAKSPTHDYLTAGTYTVIVHVRDQLGETASANLSVVVTAPSTHTGPPPPLLSSTGWILVITLVAAAVAAVVVFVWAVRRRKR